MCLRDQSSSLHAHLVRRLPISESSPTLAARRRVALCIGPVEVAEEYRLLSAARSSVLAALPFLSDVIVSEEEGGRIRAKSTDAMLTI